MFEEWEVGSELQEKADEYMLGISKEKLVSKMYREMELDGHECCVMNGKYLIVDGEEFQFIKSRKENRWIVKKL